MSAGHPSKDMIDSRPMSSSPAAAQTKVPTSGTILFTRGVPPPEAFPIDQIAECFDAALHADPAIVLQYGHQPGYPPLRQMVAAEYGITDRETLIANGSLQLQELAATSLVHPGMSVLTKQPS